ncbi:hypothetical protein D3C87_1444000 [compost metagenome]
MLDDVRVIPGWTPNNDQPVGVDVDERRLLSVVLVDLVDHHRFWITSFYSVAFLEGSTQGVSINQRLNFVRVAEEVIQFGDRWHKGDFIFVVLTTQGIVSEPDTHTVVRLPYQLVADPLGHPTDTVCNQFTTGQVLHQSTKLINQRGLEGRTIITNFTGDGFGVDPLT